MVNTVSPSAVQRPVLLKQEVMFTFWSQTSKEGSLSAGTPADIKGLNPGEGRWRRRRRRRRRED